jgi:hypothetical protein
VLIACRDITPHRHAISTDARLYLSFRPAGKLRRC